MEEILHIENNVILSRIEEELTVLGIEYFIKRTDIGALPSNLNKNRISSVRGFLPLASTLIMPKTNTAFPCRRSRQGAALFLHIRA